MRLKQNIRRMLGVAITLLFVACYANATLFVHTHIVDGKTIVHSHIYGGNHADSDSDSSSQQPNGHEHPAKQIEVISYLNHILYTDSVWSGADLDFSLYEYSEYVYACLDDAYVELAPARVNALRGPPSLL